MSENTKRITINIDNINNALPLEPQYFLHVAQFDNLFNRIDRILKKIPDFKKKLKQSTYPHCTHLRPHEAILLRGKRGTGKTTFLLSTLSLINTSSQFDNYKQEYNSTSDFTPNKLFTLRLIDPTCFTCKEHLLFIILGLIKDAIQLKQKQANMQCYETSSQPCKIETWFAKLSEMTKGLSAVGECRDDFRFEPGASNLDWNEAEYIVEQNFSNVSHSMNLEKHFHNLICNALEILEYEAFVLAIDDTDTRPIIGWHILEVLRRYLTTPQLIVIISGDFDLFKIIATQYHAKSLMLSEGQLFSNDCILSESINELTEQYLLKILPPNNRVRIGSFNENLQTTKKYLNIQDINIIIAKNEDNENKKTSLSDLLGAFFEFIGCHNRKEQEIFLEAINNNSMRIVLQVFNALWLFKHEKIKDDEFVYMLYNIFVVQLKQISLIPYNIAEMGKHLLSTVQISSISILKEPIFCRDNFLPDTADKIQNNILLIFNTFFKYTLEHSPSIIFFHLCKFCYIKEILKQNSCITLETLAGSESISKPQLISSNYIFSKNLFLVLYENINPPYSPVSFGVFYLLSSSNDVPNYDAIRLQETHQVLIDNIADREISIKRKANPKYRLELLGYNTPQLLTRKVQSYHKPFITLGMTKFSVDNGKNVIFSIFSLISLMGDILHCPDKLAIKDLLYNKIFKTGFDFSYDQELEHSDDNENQLLDELATWVKSVNLANVPLAHLLCTHIMSRFHKDLLALSNEEHTDLFFGTFIHKSLTAFFNTVLAEEFLLSKFSQNNSCQYLYDRAVNDSTYTNNILEIKNHILATSGVKNKNTSAFKLFRNKLPLFSAVFSFPLWKWYLYPEKILKDSNEKEYSVHKWYTTFNENINHDIKIVYKESYTSEKSKTYSSFYDLLNSIAIQTDINSQS